MKKIIICVLFVSTFSSGVFAKQAIVTTTVATTLATNPAPQESKYSEEIVEHCENMSVSWCGENGEVFYASGNFCAASAGDLYDMIDSVMATCD